MNSEIEETTSAESTDLRHPVSLERQKAGLVPTWAMIRVVGRSKVVSLTILVPFIGYMILFNDSILTYLSLSAKIIGRETDAATITRLHFLYYGLTLVGVASTLYQIFCPPSIKEHADEYGYVEGERAIMTQSRLTSLIPSMVQIAAPNSSEYADLSSYVSEYNATFKLLTPSLVGDGPQGIQDGVRLRVHLDILSLNWRLMSSSRPVVRFVISLMYLSGFGLVLWPSMIVFCRVTQHIFLR